MEGPPPSRPPGVTIGTVSQGVHVLFVTLGASATTPGQPYGSAYDAGADCRRRYTAASSVGSGRANR